MSELDRLDKALADLRREVAAAVPPRLVRLFLSGARLSAALTPRWPAWFRAGAGTFGLLEGILLSRTPDALVGFPAAVLGLWLLMGALGEVGRE